MVKNAKKFEKLKGKTEKEGRAKTLKPLESLTSGGAHREFLERRKRIRAILDRYNKLVPQKTRDGLRDLHAELDAVMRAEIKLAGEGDRATITLIGAHREMFNSLEPMDGVAALLASAEEKLSSTL